MANNALSPSIALGEEPDLPQTGYVLHRLGVGEYAIVPDEATPQHRRQVADDHQQTEREDGQDVLSREPPRR